MDFKETETRLMIKHLRAYAPAERLKGNHDKANEMERLADELEDELAQVSDGSQG